jgi:maltokinase
MGDPVQIHAAEIRRCLDDESLRDWVQHQRWYASKSRAVSGIEVVEGIVLREEPLLLLALVQTRFATGTHELYQLPLVLYPSAAGELGQVIARTGDWSAYDALVEPRQLLELVRRMDSGAEIDAADGRFSFHRADGVAEVSDDATVRLVGVEQSNSSLVFDEQFVLKVFRKLEPGINPELELLRFLTARGFPNIAPLHGWYDYDGHALAATLGVAQKFFPEATGGWELALEKIGTDPEWFLDRLGSLGAVTAQMHTVLASDASDPAFSPEEPSQESMALLTATVDEDIERMFVRLPDDQRVAPIVGRGQDVRERLAARAQIGVGGRVIRTHGDYHLGQTLRTPAGWVIIDFEGEPARALPERRAKRSPLRDVASMLRSFAYVTSAVELQRGGNAPADFERRARERFLEHYFAEVDTALLPPGAAAIKSVLSIFELEKAVYELQYELNNRPDWVPIPVAGIGRARRIGGARAFKPACRARRSPGREGRRDSRPASGGARDHGSPRRRRHRRARADPCRRCVRGGGRGRGAAAPLPAGGRLRLRGNVHDRRPVCVRADDRRRRPASDRRRPPRGHLREARRPRARASGGQRNRVRGLGARRPGAQRSRRLQLLGRSTARDALARFGRDLGAVLARRSPGRSLQV